MGGVIVSDLKIEVPVELKPNIDKLKSDVEGTKLKAKVELEPVAGAGFAKAARDLSNGVNANRRNSSNLLGINVDSAKKEIAEVLAMVKRAQGEMNKLASRANILDDDVDKPIIQAMQRINETMERNKAELDRLMGLGNDDELLANYQGFIKTLRSSLKEIKSVFSQTDSGFVSFSTHDAENALNDLRNSAKKAEEVLNSLGETDPRREELGKWITSLNQQINTLSENLDKIKKDQLAFGLIDSETNNIFKDAMDEAKDAEKEATRIAKKIRKDFETAKTAASKQPEAKPAILASERDREQIVQQIALLKQYKAALGSIQGLSGLSQARQRSLSSLLDEDIATLERLQTLLADKDSTLPEDYQTLMKNIASDLSATGKFSKMFDVDPEDFNWTKINTGIQNFAKDFNKAQQLIDKSKEDIGDNEKLKKLSENLKEYSAAQKAYNESLGPLKQAQIAGEVPEAENVKKAIQAKLELIRVHDQLVASYKELTGAQEGANQEMSAEEVAKAQATIFQKLERMKWIRKNYSRAFKDASWAADFEALENAFKADDAIRNYQQLSKQLSILEMRARAAGNAGKTLGDRFRGAFAKFGEWFSVSQIFMKLVELSKMVVANVKAVDTEMTNLRKVSDAREGEYDQYLQNAAKRSADLGTKLTNYISGTTGWARTGESLEDAQTLGELSTIYYNVGDGIESVDDATASLISTMKAFKIETSDASKVLDILNHVGNNYNITSGGLGEAFQRSAVALAAANTDINKSAALITAGNTILNHPEKVGNGLKTLSARLRGATSDLSELGEESDEYVVSSSKMQAKVEALTGVDIMKNATEFKDIYDILDEIAQVWDDLSDTTRADLAETLFGKNQSNLGIAILSNFETAREVLKDLTSGEATGSAMKEYDKYLGSVEAKTKKLSSNFERFSVGILDPDVLKVALDLINGLLEGVTNLVETLGSLPTVLGAISAAFSIFKPDSGIVKVQYAPPMKNSLAA